MEHSQPRRWWLSGTLSMLVPGLGQVYNGQLVRAVAMSVLMILVPAAVLVWVLVEDVLYLWIAVPMLLLLCIHMWIITDASLVSRRLDPGYQPRPCNRIWVYVVFSMVVAAAFHVGQWAVARWCFQVHRVQVAAATVNLEEGDHVLVNRLAFGITGGDDARPAWWWRDPQRGSMVVYEGAGAVVRPGRCLAEAGEIVETRGDMITVQSFAVRGGLDAGVVWVPPLEEGAVGRRVPEDHVCVLAQRQVDGGLTEPVLEMVPRARIIGEPMFIFWSVKSDRRQLRIERIGLPVF